MDYAVIRDIALALPDVEDATTPRGMAFKARGKLLACTATHSSAAQGSLAVRIDRQLRAELLAAEPDVYYLTPHYESYPMVLVRLARIRRPGLRKLLGTAWVFVTSKAAKRPRRPAKNAARRNRASGARRRSE